MQSRLPVLLPLFLLLVPPVLVAQNIAATRSAYRLEISRTADSLRSAQRLFADTLVARGARHTRAAVRTVAFAEDSLLRGVGAPLDPGRKSLFLRKSGIMKQDLTVLGTAYRDTVHMLLAEFGRRLSTLLTLRGTCPGCVASEDFNAAAELFSDEADSVSDLTSDSMGIVLENWEIAAEEKADVLCDSLDEYAQELRSAYDDEGSRVAIGLGIDGHLSYRGRDNGVKQSLFAPSVAYHHRSGVFLSGLLGWVSPSRKGVDQADLSLGYEFSPASIMECSFSYTRFWFSDSSADSRAVASNSLGASLAIDLSVVTLGTLLGYDFGTGGEFSFSVEVWKEIPVLDGLFDGEIMLIPAATLTWGAQNQEFLTRRGQRALPGSNGKRQKAGVQQASVFGIMAYEVSLPIALSLGTLTVQPSLSYIVPVNVIDASGTEPFASASLQMSVTIR